MKKNLLVLPNLVTGGGQKLVIDIATRLHKQKFDVTVLSLYERQGYMFEKIADENNVNVIYLNKKVGFDVKVIFDVHKVIKKYKPHIIHTHLYVMPYVLIPTLLNNIKKRVHTVHTMAWRESKGIQKIIMSISYKIFNFIPVAISEENKNALVQEYNFTGNQVKCIHNGIDTIHFRKINTHNSSNNEIVFVSVARFEEVKNHQLMIHAFFEVNKKFPSTKLVLIGDGELRSQIETLVHDLKIENNVVFKGIQENVLEELNQADIYLISSNVEGLPLSVLEAMSCELPVISTKAGGIVDIVKDGENGLVVPVDNKFEFQAAMKKLISDSELRKMMSKNSRKLAIQWDIKNCVDNYEKLYEN